MDDEVREAKVKVADYYKDSEEEAKVKAADY